MMIMFVFLQNTFGRFNSRHQKAAQYQKDDTPVSSRERLDEGARTRGDETRGRR